MIKQAVFLVGGRGTRLGSLTDGTPKPLLPVGGRPFLDYLIEKAVSHGVTDILLLCGYLADTLAERYGSGGPGGSTIRLVVEPEPAGTAGALLYARGLLEDRFFMANGDSFFGFDWDRLAAAQTEAIGTLALRSNAPGRRSGTVDFDGMMIHGFYGPAEGREGPINAGVYALRRDLLDWVGPPPCSIENDVFPRLAKAGRLCGMLSDGYFIDIGIPEDYERAHRELPGAAVADA